MAPPTAAARTRTTPITMIAVELPLLAESESVKAFYEF
jgi:hypothetical protein